MKHLLIATVATLGLVSAAAAQSSSTTVTTTTGGAAATTGATGTVTIAPEQRTRIREYVVKENRRSVAAPSGFSVAIGATLPETVELYSLPSEAGVTQYRYSVVGDRTVLVEPGTRRIIQVIE